MNVKSLIEFEGKLLEEIRREYCDPTGESELIKDGVVNPEQYISSKKKILWILKEPYCDGYKFKGGGWPLIEDEKTDSISRWRTFQPLCYINHGIWSDVHNWNQMPWLRDSEEIRIGLKKIAVINISKLPGLKTSSAQRIKDAYKKYHGVIWKQINGYSPEIIFGCDPHVNLILKDLGISTEKWKWPGKTAAVVEIKPGQRLVWVAHPSQRQIRREDYINDAIKAATVKLS